MKGMVMAVAVEVEVITKNIMIVVKTVVISLVVTSTGEMQKTKEARHGKTAG